MAKATLVLRLYYPFLIEDVVQASWKIVARFLLISLGLTPGKRAKTGEGTEHLDGLCFALSHNGGKSLPVGLLCAPLCKATASLWS